MAPADELEAMGVRLEEINMRETSISTVVLRLRHILESPRASHSVGLGWGLTPTFLIHVSNDAGPSGSEPLAFSFTAPF